MDNDIEWHLAKAEVKIEPMEHDNEYVKWEDTDLYKEIKADKTAGGMLHAFRMREGMSIMELAKKTTPRGEVRVCAFPRRECLKRHERKLINFSHYSSLQLP